MRALPLKFKNTLQSNFPFIILLLGIALISFSIGNFQNPDTAWEFKAANGVIMWGMPFVEVPGSLMNQPPLGFYAEGAFLSLFGGNIETGTILIGIFGLGCTIIVYQLGKLLYSKNTGLLASALFALTPWQLVLSNSFLIDTQCLFFSISSLYVGILSFRRQSDKLFAVSAVLFALAFYTKLFAVFALIPLALFYLYEQRKNLKSLSKNLTIFSIPLFLATVIWYAVDYFLMPNYLTKGIGYLFSHSDFNDLNPTGVVPTYSFVSTFLLDYALGYFFLAAVILSLVLGFALRKQIGKRIALYDFFFLLPILLVVGLTMFLGVTQNLKVPYTSAIKYLYHTLPFFTILAASLAFKCYTIIKSQAQKQRKPFLIIGLIGFLLLGLSVFSSVYSANQLSLKEFIIFSVEPGKLLGYSFNNVESLTQNSPLLIIQYLGVGLVFAALIFSLKPHIINFLVSRKTTV
jgi:4-amino-4-deoxy-L-arabinose transferase-like glycosyltransferase